MSRTFVIILLSSLVALSGAFAQDAPLALTGATVVPITGPPIENGVLLVEDGVVVAVGAADSVEIPDDATVRDLTGKVLLPGFVDTHSHVGRVEGGDSSSALHPEVRVLDAVDVRADSFRRALAGGITTVNVLSGSGHLMSGQTVYLKLRPDPRSIDDWLFCDDPLTDVCGGMKMANGTNPIRDQPPFPGTRAKSAALVRKLFVEAQDYRAKKRAAADDPEKAPDRDLGLEALLQVFDGTRIVHNHTHRHDDILTALRLGEEFGYVPVLHHVSEGWKVAEEIAAAGAPASIIVIDSPGGKHEAVDLKWETGRILEEAGVDVAFHTDDYITDSRLFLRSAGLAVRAGMSEPKALEGLTLAGARMLGLEDRVGSLEPGKDADFVILSGDPLSIYTKVEETWVEGRKVFDRSDPQDRAFAVGGEGVYRPERLHTHGREDR